MLSLAANLSVRGAGKGAFYNNVHLPFIFMQFVVIGRRGISNFETNVFFRSILYGMRDFAFYRNLFAFF